MVGPLGSPTVSIKKKKKRDPKPEPPADTSTPVRSPPTARGRRRHSSERSRWQAVQWSAHVSKASYRPPHLQRTHHPPTTIPITRSNHLRNHQLETETRSLTLGPPARAAAVTTETEERRTNAQFAAGSYSSFSESHPLLQPGGALAGYIVEKPRKADKTQRAPTDHVLEMISGMVETFPHLHQHVETKFCP